MTFLQEKIYPIVPVFVQNAMISAFGYQWQKRRFGGCFPDFLQEVRAREFFDVVQWQEIQTNSLRNLLVHAFNNVQFYHSKYLSAGFSEVDLENFNLTDLKHLPLLEKDELRQFGTTTLLAKILSKGISISSSGSTGTTTRSYLPQYFH